MRWILFALLFVGSLPTACGAGAITGGVLGTRGRNPAVPPPSRIPGFTVDNPEAPLVGVSTLLQRRTLAIANIPVPDSASLRIELRALGVIDEQFSPILLSSEPNLIRVAFLQFNPNILRQVADPTLADVPAELFLLVQGREVAAPIPFRLVRQARAELVKPIGAPPQAEISVLGGTQLTFRLWGKRAADLLEPQLLFVTPDPTGERQFLSQVVSSVEVIDEPATDSVLVKGGAPQSSVPVQVLAAVVDARSGQSTPIDSIFYRPEITAALPREGVTDGGTLISLFGQGLVPLDYGPQPPVLDFSRIMLEIQKGGRRTVVPAALIRPDLSSSGRLVFTMPPSPDGRAGPADVVLSVRLTGTNPQTVSAVKLGALVYGHRDPTFGPRGALLPERPTGVAVAQLEGVGGPDLATVSIGTGVPRLQLFLSDGNGMFVRFNRPFDAANPSNQSQRESRALVAGDFDQDGLNDLIVVNQGIGNRAEHTMLRGQAAPLPPLALLPDFGQGDSNRAAVALAADWNADGATDFLVLPDHLANDTRAKVFFAAPEGKGLPVFLPMPLTVAGSGPFDAAAALDLDDDGLLDIVLCRGGDRPELVTLFGTGEGGFVLGESLPLVVPGYQDDAQVPVVGVHGVGKGAERAVAVVFAGLASSAITPPTVALLKAGSGQRSLRLPSAAGVFALPFTDEPFVSSLSRDLNNDGAVEIIVAAGGVPGTPLRVLTRENDRYVERVDAVGPTVERLEGITGLHCDVLSVPDVSDEGPEGPLGLFVVHRVDVEGVFENRVSTFVVGAGLKLLAPDAALRSALPVKGLVYGDFTGRVRGDEGSPRDLCVATAAGLTVLHNDGFGNFTPAPGEPVSELVPEAMATLQTSIGSAKGEAVVFLQQNGHVSVRMPGGGITTSQFDLRSFADTQLRSRTPGPRSRMVTGDVDGDGVPDVVLLLSLASTEPVEGEALLILLRGKATALPGQFPLHLPAGAASVAPLHGNAESLALGDLVREPPNVARQLEVAVAVPRGDPTRPELGNHIRFYRSNLDTTGGDVRLQRSFADSEAPVLLAGDQPMRILLADLDRNGLLDVVVACAGDNRLRIFLSDGSRLPGQEAEVNVRSFREALGVAQTLPPGVPKALLSADLTGDGGASIVAVTRDAQTGRPIETNMAVYVPDGVGALRLVELLPGLRTGNRVRNGSSTILRDAAAVVALKDCNGDGRPDLAIGWDSVTGNDFNVRVLFGGVR